MKIKLEQVDIKAEVVIFNDELDVVKILSKGEIQAEYKDKVIIPICNKGRLIDFQFKFKDGYYYKSYVAGLNNRIKQIGYVLKGVSAKQALKDVEQNNLDIVEDGELSNIIVLFFN